MHGVTRLVFDDTGCTWWLNFGWSYGIVPTPTPPPHAHRHSVTTAPGACMHAGVGVVGWGVAPVVGAVAQVEFLNPGAFLVVGYNGAFLAELPLQRNSTTPGMTSNQVMSRSH